MGVRPPEWACSPMSRHPGITGGLAGTSRRDLYHSGTGGRGLLQCFLASPSHGAKKRPAAQRWEKGLHLPSPQEHPRAKRKRASWFYSGQGNWDENRLVVTSVVTNGFNSTSGLI